MRTRPLLGAGVALLLLGLAGGCADDLSPEPASLDSIRTGSPTPSVQAPTATSEPVADGDGDGDGGQAARGGYDAEQLVSAIKAAFEDKATSHVVLRSNGVSEMRAVADVDYRGASPAMRMRMSMPALGVGRIDMRVVDETLYISIPPSTPKGKYVALRPGDPNNPLGADGRLTDQMDPRKTFESFSKALKKVRYVGEEEVDGEPMDHYRLTVRTAALAGMGQQPTAGLPPTFVYELWLDGQDLMRKAVFDTGTVSMTMEMSRWGEPVTITAPPAAAVIEGSGR